MPETFSRQLRQTRTERGLSLRDLSTIVHYSCGYLSKVENGLMPASPELARLCDEALATGGMLVALAPPPRRRDQRAPPSVPDDGDEFSIEADFTTVSTFESMFGHHRMLGHRSSPRAVLDGLLPHATTLRTMARSTREPELRDSLWLLAARYAEYAGWMAQEAGDEQTATRMTDIAVRCAVAGGDHELAGYALVRCAEFSLYRNDARQTVLLARRAQTSPDASVAVRALGAEREAQGYALAGAEVQCRQALQRATELHHEMAGAASRFGTTSLADPVAIAEAWSMYDLGRPHEAAELLDRQVPLILEVALRSRTRFGLRRALAHAAVGEVDHACAIAVDLLDDVRRVDSATVRIDLASFAKVLAGRKIPVGGHDLRRRINEILFPHTGDGYQP